MTVEQFAMLQRIEAKLDKLLLLLAEDDGDEPELTLDGESAGSAREPGQPL